MRFASRLCWPAFAKALPSFIQGKGFIFDRRVPDIRQPIVVHIAEINAHARQGVAFFVICNARLKADLLKSLSIDVMEEEVWAVVVGDKNIGPAIVVIVGEGDAQSLALDLGDSGLHRDIGERTVAVVAVQSVGQRSEAAGAGNRAR